MLPSNDKKEVKLINATDTFKVFRRHVIKFGPENIYLAFSCYTLKTNPGFLKTCSYLQFYLKVPKKYKLKFYLHFKKNICLYKKEKSI